jgi:hypothetical protein
MFLRNTNFTISRRALLFLAAGLFLAPVARAIERIPVESSNLRSVGYDVKTRTLEVQFTHGGIYRYFAVPAEVHSGLMKSDSKGKYFQANVRNKFRFERLAGGK